jgi:deoxyribose-phosphate aldolase
VRNYADALRVVRLGAARIGTSSTEAIAAGERTGSHQTCGQGSY